MSSFMKVLIYVLFLTISPTLLAVENAEHSHSNSELINTDMSQVECKSACMGKGPQPKCEHNCYGTELESCHSNCKSLGYQPKCQYNCKGITPRDILINIYSLMGLGISYGLYRWSFSPAPAFVGANAAPMAPPPSSICRKITLAILSLYVANLVFWNMPAI